MAQPTNYDLGPRNELEQALAEAQMGRISTEEALRALVRLPVFIPSRQPVQADGAGLMPVILTQSGTDYVAVYTSLERAGSLSEQARYCLQFAGGELLPRLPQDVGLVINAGYTLGFQVEPFGIQKIRETLIVPTKEKTMPFLDSVLLADYAESLNFLPDVITLVCGQTKGEIKIWKAAEKFTEVSSSNSGFDRLYGTALSPDGTRLVTIGEGPLRVHEMQRENVPGKSVLRQAFSDDYLSSTTFSPDGTRVLAAGNAEELHVIGLQTKQVEQDAGPGTNEDAEDGFWLRERTSSLVFHPNGQTLLATSSSQGGSALLFCDLNFYQEGYWLTERNDLTVRLLADVLSPAAFSPDGRFFAFADWECHLYQFPDQERLASFDLQGTRRGGSLPDRGGAVVDASWSNALFTPDSRTLICGSPTGSIYLWDIPSGDLRQTLMGHEGNVLALALNSTGTRLVSSGRDKTLRLWQVPA